MIDIKKNPNFFEKNPIYSSKNKIEEKIAMIDQLTTSYMKKKTIIQLKTMEFKELNSKKEIFWEILIGILLIIGGLFLLKLDRNEFENKDIGAFVLIFFGFFMITYRRLDKKELDQHYIIIRPNNIDIPIKKTHSRLKWSDISNITCVIDFGEIIRSAKFTRRKKIETKVIIEPDMNFFVRLQSLYGESLSNYLDWSIQITTRNGQEFIFFPDIYHLYEQVPENYSQNTNLVEIYSQIHNYYCFRIIYEYWQKSK